MNRLGSLMDNETALGQATLTESLVALRLTSIVHGADRVQFFEFRGPDGSDLPPFSAGAHVDIILPNDLTRQYSLSNDQSERHRYVLGVKHDPASRGGSRWLHEQSRVGSVFTVGVPRNHFPLNETAAQTVLFAGGIGLTPIWCMIQRLEALHRPWRLHLAARSRAETPLLAELAVFGERVSLHFDQEAGTVFDMAAAVAATDPAAHLYCCGPTPMLAAFETAVQGRPEDHIHVEYFAPRAAAAVDGGFVVELARAGRTVAVSPGQTILDALLAAGIEAPSSCQQGICGVCETAVVSGVPDHRDSVLTPTEQASGQTMMICCSGALGDRLVLDL